LKVERSFVICKHNSLVGQIINACGNLSCLLISCNNGNPKAAVFPVPVCARPIKSFVPCNNTGMAFSWIGVGCVKPKALMDCNNPYSIPNSSNVITDYIDLNDKAAKVTLKA